MERMNIFCPHFSACSGCSIDSDVAETRTFNEAKNFFAGLGVPDLRLYTGHPSGWRCRAKLAVRGTKEEPLIGLFRAGSHLVSDIPNCRVQHPLINMAANFLRNWIVAFGMVPYNEKTGKGVLRYVELAVDRENQRVQLVLVLNQKEDEALGSDGQNFAIESLWKGHPEMWHSIWLNFNKRRDNVILGDRWKRLYGEELLWDRFCGHRVCFHPASFAQANPEMFEKLLLRLCNSVPQGTNGVEFYAGGGVIGMTVVEKCQTLCCNEIVSVAEQCFQESYKHLPEESKNKLTFICGPAEKQTDLLNQVDLVIVDPPRKGVDEGLLRCLCNKSKVKRLIYVSCGWKSFQRDCNKLLEHEWKLTSAESFLFFPGSDHLEILAVFDR